MSIKSLISIQDSCIEKKFSDCHGFSICSIIIRGCY